VTPHFITNTMNTVADVDSVLDLFLPVDLVKMLEYQCSTRYELWEQRHIDAMNTVCEYVEEVHPTHYDSIAGIHRKFEYMEAND
jgi:hypothetical protein